MKTERHIFLIPGFFGFANLGDFTYWGPVIDKLHHLLDEAGLPASIHTVKSLPTASLRARTRCLLETITSVRPGTGANIHLIGHSTGGLDARLLLTPAVDLNTRIDVEKYAAHVRSCISVATPHQGAPIASFFTSVLGRKLLRLLSALTISALRQGRLPLSVWTRVAGLFALPPSLTGASSSLVSQLYRDLLSDFDARRYAEVHELLSSVESDQALLTQLTVETMDLFNASAGNRDSVRYGSVVTKAQTPGLSTSMEIGLNAADQAQHALYYSLSRLATGYEFHPPNEKFRRALKARFGELPDSSANDGIVPTLSQPWGECIAIAFADHLDIIGHFHDDTGTEHHYDWLTTHSNFRETDFNDVWRRVTAFIASSEGVG